MSISNFVSRKLSEIAENNQKSVHDFETQETETIRHQKKYNPSLKHDFRKLLEKSESLAKIFGGQCISHNSFSNCKGRNSIRFNCQNGHNFYLTENQIQDSNLEMVQTDFKCQKREMKQA